MKTSKIYELMKTSKTYEVKIYSGFKEKYDGKEHNIKELEEICQKYVDEVGLCVTITPTKYIYTGGNEEGAIIGLIQYPRYEAPELDILYHAVDLAREIMFAFRQYRVTIVAPDKTYMLKNEKEVIKETSKTEKYARN